MLEPWPCSVWLKFDLDSEDFRWDSWSVRATSPFTRVTPATRQISDTDPNSHRCTYPHRCICSNKFRKEQWKEWLHSNGKKKKKFFVRLQMLKRWTVCTKARLNYLTVCHTSYPSFLCVIVLLLSCLLSLSFHYSMYSFQVCIIMSAVDSEVCRTPDSAFYMCSLSSMTEVVSVCLGWRTKGGVKDVQERSPVIQSHLKHSPVICFVCAFFPVPNASVYHDTFSVCVCVCDRAGVIW